MRIMLTGATGYVGGSIAARALGAGHAVGAITRPQSNTAQLEAMPGEKRLYPVSGTVESISAALVDFSPDCVIHVAALVSSDHAPQDVIPLVRSNVELGAVLAEAATSAGCRCFVSAGSYWQHYGGRRYSPVNLYAATKQAFEDILLYYAEARGLKSICLHLCDVYGPGDTRPKIITQLRAAADSGAHVSMTPGYQRVDLVHVNDAASAFLCAASRLCADAGAGGFLETYAVRSGTTLTLRGLVTMFEEVRGLPIDAGWGEKAYRARQVFKPTRRPRVLPGWTPKISLREGLKSL